MFIKQYKLTAAALLFFIICLMLLYSNYASRLNGDKANQVMRDIRTAEATFKNSNGTGRYGTLKELAEVRLISSSLTDGEERGYKYEVKTDGVSYEAIAIPLERNDKYEYFGWSFYLNQSGVIRGRACGKANGYSVANKDDPPVRYQ